MAKEFNGRVLQQMIDLIQDSKKMPAILDAIKQADEAQDHFYRLFFRYMYACEATFHDDPPKAMPVAIEFSAIFEQYPDVLGPDGGEMYIMIMQMAIDPIVSLPQIPFEQWQGMIEQYYKLVKRFNLGHRTYWKQMSQFYIYLDKKKAYELFERFWKTGRDGLSDCRTCDRCYAIRMHLLVDDEEGANEMAKPIKQKRMWFCHDTPHLMHLAYIEYYMNQGNAKAAKPYAYELKGIGHRDKHDLSYMGAVIRCLTYFDSQTALQFVEQGMEWVIGIWDCKLAYDFYKGAWVLMHQLSKTWETISIKMPANFALKNDSDVYNVVDLEQYFYDNVKSIANRFDERNGTDSYNENFKLAMMEPKIVE